jgi:hypothetical protein
MLDEPAVSDRTFETFAATTGERVRRANDERDLTFAGIAAPAASRSPARRASATTPRWWTY